MLIKLLEVIYNEANFDIFIGGVDGCFPGSVQRNSIPKKLSAKLSVE